MEREGEATEKRGRETNRKRDLQREREGERKEMPRQKTCSRIGQTRPREVDGGNPANPFSSLLTRKKSEMAMERMSSEGCCRKRGQIQNTRHTTQDPKMPSRPKVSEAAVNSCAPILHGYYTVLARMGGGRFLVGRQRKCCLHKGRRRLARKGNGSTFGTKRALVYRAPNQTNGKRE